MAKNPGKKFEEDFVKSIPDRCDVTRLKDAGGWSNATNMRFTSSNPCDFIVFTEGRTLDWNVKMYKLELKSVQGKSLPHSNIKDHQIDAMVKSEKKGVLAKFIVNFRGANETYAISALSVKNDMLASGRKSLSLENAKLLGMKLPQTLKRTRYKYDLEWL